VTFVAVNWQDDPGVNYNDSTPSSFGTALKARLFCDFEGPNTGDNPLAASDMRFNNICKSWGGRVLPTLSHLCLESLYLFFLLLLLLLLLEQGALLSVVVV